MGFGSFLKKTVGTIGGGIIGGLVGGPAGAVIGAGIGNAYDSSKASSKAQNKQNELAQSQYDQNVALQKEFAQNSMQWRVDDAKKAGLHPMAALGLQGSSFSPVQTINYAGYQDNTASNLMNAISDMGQSVNYASTKGKDSQQQQVAVRLAQEGVELQNEGLRLDNEYKKWRLLQVMETGTSQALRSPAAPPVKDNSLIRGQGDSPISGDTFSSGTTPLMSLSRMGNILVAHVDPDKSDALTEDFLKNLMTQVSFTQNALNGEFGLEVAKHFTPTEQKALRNRDAYLAVIPGVGWRFVWDEKFKPRYSKNGQEVSGKLNRY